MGNGKSVNDHGVLHGDAIKYAERFDEDEVCVIKKTWEEMAERNNGEGIDKDTFLQYFPLLGLLGDRLFAQFNQQSHKCLDYDEFITGLAIICRGSTDEKIHFLFDMYDVSHSHKILKSEISTLINQFPKEYVQSATHETEEPESTIDEYGVDAFTNHSRLERSFEECHIEHDYLDYEDFERFISKNAYILEYIESMFPYAGTKTRARGKSNAIPHVRRVSMRTSFLRQNSHHGNIAAVEDVAGELFRHDQINQMRAASCSPGLSISSPDEIATTSVDVSLDKEVYEKVVAMEDYLSKPGNFSHMMVTRYYMLIGNCLYYYAKKGDSQPKGVILIAGCIVERINDKDSQGQFGFEIAQQDLCSGEHYHHERRVMYAKSAELRDKWVVALQHAGHVVPIEEEYTIGAELGRGISIVCECIHKRTNEHCAVKIIDKSSIAKAEKDSLRNEIAILKLVHHPNIVQMRGVYESKKFIYIVMEKVKGGELFSKIVGRPRFKEPEFKRLLRPLLEAVAYLHDLGIVHRDLKPENILCGDEWEDIKVADFGLSKMVMPKEKMDAACGTPSYLAPEVLTFQGYGKEADLWSVGCIMFLLLCGKVPFDGDSTPEIRASIQNGFTVNPNVWNNLSEHGKNLIMSLLEKDAKRRITARDALKHPFLHGTVSPTRRLSVSSPITPSASERMHLNSFSVDISGDNDNPPCTPITAKSEFGTLSAPLPRHATPVVRFLVEESPDGSRRSASPCMPPEPPKEPSDISEQLPTSSSDVETVQTNES